MSTAVNRGAIVADPDSDPSNPYVLGLLDPVSDPVVRDMLPDPSIIKQK
jgi:hypothetical protein